MNYTRPNGDNRFATLSGSVQGVPSSEMDKEWSNLKDEVNKGLPKDGSEVMTGALRHGGISKQLKGNDIAPAATVLTPGTDGNYFDVTGTNPMSTIATVAIGTVISLHFDDIITLTHSANLVLQNAVNITTVAGDELTFIEFDTGKWRLVGSAGSLLPATPLTTQGDILIRDGGGPVRLAAGTSGQVLRTKGTGVNPLWATIPCAGFTNIGANYDALIVDAKTNATVDIDAFNGVVYSTPGRIGVPTGAINLTLNISGTGADGRDVTENSGNEKASSWYYLWVIMKEDGSLASFATLAATYPSALPATYVYASLVGVIYNDSGSLFVDIYQEGTRVEYVLNEVMLNGSFAVSTWTSLSVTSFFPPNAKRIHVLGAANGRWLGISPRSDGHAGAYSNINIPTATDFGIISAAMSSIANLDIRYASSIYYYSAAADAELDALGWEY